GLARGIEAIVAQQIKHAGEMRSKPGLQIDHAFVHYHSEALAPSRSITGQFHSLFPMCGRAESARVRRDAALPRSRALACIPRARGRQRLRTIVAQSVHPSSQRLRCVHNARELGCETIFTSPRTGAPVNPVHRCALDSHSRYGHGRVRRMKALFIDCNDQLAPVWAKVAQPDDPEIDVNQTDRVTDDLPRVLAGYEI